MDQEPTKRRGGRKRAAETAPDAANESESTADQTPRLPDGSAEGDEMRGVQADSPGVALHDPRAAIADGLAALLTPTQVTFLLEEVLAINKRVAIRGECKNCGHYISDYTEVPDAKAVVSALTDLINHGFGRPDVAKFERDMIEFRRFTDFTEWDNRET